MMMRRHTPSLTGNDSPLLPLQQCNGSEAAGIHMQQRQRLSTTKGSKGSTCGVGYLSKKQIVALNPKTFITFVVATTLLVCSFRMSVPRKTLPSTTRTTTAVGRSLETDTKNDETSKPLKIAENSFHVTPLTAIDYEKFTVRINTWQRDEQLRLSIQHHLTCTAVAQVQIVWCVDQGDVPVWLVEMDGSDERVVVERHAVNTLNERFSILPQANALSTAAILSADDDVIRPCLALEAAFLKWTRNPDRQVGFDARSHQVVHDNRWKYAYMSTTEKSNKYSITLTRYSFLHRDYMASYMQDMPAIIRETVAKNLNCEDIAMSLWISFLTGGQPPLLADMWAVKSQIKMYVPVKISGGDKHKDLRDDCMNSFADLLELKSRLEPATLQRTDYFDYGATADNWNTVPTSHNRNDHLHSETEDTVQRWRVQGNKLMIRELSDLKMKASQQIFDQGLLENTQPWNERFHPAKATR